MARIDGIDAKIDALGAHLESEMERQLQGAAPGKALSALEQIEANARQMAQAAEVWKGHAGESSGALLASALEKIADKVSAAADRLAERIRGASGLFVAKPPRGAPPTPPVKPAKPPKATTPAKPAKTPKSEKPKTHTVVKGDTLWDIARRNHVSLERLIRANKHIGNPDLLYHGDKVKIPGRTKAASGSDGSDGPDAARPSSGGSGAQRPPRKPAVSRPPQASGAQQAQQPQQAASARADGPTPPRGSVAAKVLRYREEIQAAARKYDVPAALIAATIEHESGGRADARSFDGGHGKGLMQIDDRFHAIARSSKVFDPKTNVEYGAKLIAQNLKAFPGNLRAGIAAFNAGIGGVQSALRKGRDPSSATYDKGYISKIQASMRKYDRYL